MNKYYKILGLEEGASKEEIQQAYEKLSTDLDPSKNDNLDFFLEEYKKVQEAYKKLNLYHESIEKITVEKLEDDKEIESNKSDDLSKIDQTKIEITETDITKYSNLKSDNISVFGISIGMSKSEFNKLKDQNKNLYFEVEKPTEFGGEKLKMEDYRIYVYNKKENVKKENRFFKWFFSSEKNSKKDCILYLIWEKKSNLLTQITFFEDFKPYLIGLSSRLLTFDTIDSNSKISKEYLGNPDETKVTLDVPSIKLKNISYFFKSKGISITEVNSENSKTISMGFKNFNKEMKIN